MIAAAGAAQDPGAVRPLQGGRVRGAQAQAVPTLVVVTGLIWATEAMRLFLVVEAMGFSDVHIGISGAFFVALTASLLTAVPLTPAGIGFVEGAVVGLLTFVTASARPRRSRSSSSTGRSASCR